MIFDCIIIGGGAAGCFAAANIMEQCPDAKVLLLEKSGKLLSKVRISGGGRCNVTHRFIDIPSFAVNYPRGEKFMRRILHHFSPVSTFEWFENRGVSLKTEADGRVFPVSNNSDSVIQCLMREMDGVKINMHEGAKHIQYKDGRWEVVGLSNIFFSRFVLLSCGGGVNKKSFSWLDNLNLKIADPAPSLFSFNMKHHPFKDLMGISVQQIRIKIAGTKLIGVGPAVITHWGMSGPAILRLSAFGAYEMQQCAYKFTIIINWLPEFSEDEVFESLTHFRSINGNRTFSFRAFQELPDRLWQKILEMSAIDASEKWSAAGSGTLRKLARQLTAMEVAIDGRTTYKEEFVTAGGIDLNEVNHTTCESKHWQGLHFAGEMLNTDGVTGGFNFQHAWSTGYLAASNIAKQINLLK